MTVKRLTEELDRDELLEWMAFDNVSPIGGERLDYLSAIGNSLLANCHSKRRWKEKHFLPKWGSDTKKGSTPEEIRAWFARAKSEQERRTSGG